MLAAKGMSTRDIADITGWGHSIIAKDLQVSKNGQEASKNGQTSADPDRAVAPDPDRARNEERTAEVAAAAEAEGVTSEPSFDRGPEEKYRIVYADPPWSYDDTTLVPHRRGLPAGDAREHYHAPEPAPR